MRITSTIPYSENVNFAETSRPLGIPRDKDWFNKPHTVKQAIVITIQGVKSRNYVCMDSRGRVYGAVSSNLATGLWLPERDFYLFNVLNINSKAIHI
jgi:hypothetical protein